MKSAITSLLLSSVLLLPARGIAQQSSVDPIATQAQVPPQFKQPSRLTTPARRTVAFQSTLSAVKEYCGKHQDNASCKSDSTEYDAASKLVEKNPELQAYIETGVPPDKPIKFGSLPPPYKSDAHNSDKSQTTESYATVDSVSAAKARADKACNYGVSMTPSDITSTMVNCDKATSEWEDALRSEAAVQNRAKTEAMNRTASTSGGYVISLTGTTGLPVTGTCSFAGKSESFDDVVPAEHMATAGRGIICSFVKKYVEGTLKMQIIQNGIVRDEAETEASYGVVSLTVDW